MYLSLDDEARQQLALQQYLSQLDNEQVAFRVKQRKPKSNEAAVGATLELKSYSVKPNGMVATVQHMVTVWLGIPQDHKVGAITAYCYAISNANGGTGYIAWKH